MTPDRITGWRLICAWSLVILLPWLAVGWALWLVLS